MNKNLLTRTTEDLENKGPLKRLKFLGGD